MKNVFALILLTLSILAFSATPVVIEFTKDTTALYFEEYFDLFNKIEEYENAEVYKAMDGDTIWVTIGRWFTKVRMIGLDTPMTVHPTKPAEHFGKEALNFVKKILTGKKVKLSYDRNEFGKYNQLLAYVWVPVQHDNSTKYVLFNLLMIINGYGYAYLYFPFKDEYMKIFKDAQDYAREKSTGFWASKVIDNAAKSVRPGISGKLNVVISCIHYAENPEYIEIRNYGNVAVNLKGWIITDEGAKHVYIFGDLELKPLYFVRLYSGPKATQNIWMRAYIWNNDGDIGYLYDSDGILIDKYSY